MPVAPPIPEPPEAIESIAQAAARQGLSTRTIRRRIADGSLTGYRVGPRLIRVSVAEVDALLNPIPTVGTLR